MSFAALVAEASNPYLKAGPGLFAYFFARGKLGLDPVYRAILEFGMLQNRARILDLGCGQGLLAAWLQAAVRCHSTGRYPAGWPAPPLPLSTRGIELMARDVRRAYRALGPDGGVILGDIRDVEFGAADAVVILDVMHYLTPDAQRDVLLRVRKALPADGLLLLRICDAADAPRFRFTQRVDRVVMRARGHARPALYSRSVHEWCELLEACGFRSEATPMSHGTPFANVLLTAYPDCGARS